MLSMNNYIINLKAINSAVKTFKYELSDEFFKNLDGSEIEGGTLAVELNVKPTSGAFELKFEIRGDVKVVCDRCLDELVLPIDINTELKVKFGDELDDTDELITVPEDDGTLSVDWIIYEIVDLSLPIKRVHQDGECNEKMMSTLQGLLSVETEE